MKEPININYLETRKMALNKKNKLLTQKSKKCVKILEKLSGKEEKNLTQRADGQRETHAYTEFCFIEESSFVLLLIYFKRQSVGHEQIFESVICLEEFAI